MTKDNTMQTEFIKDLINYKKYDTEAANQN